MTNPARRAVERLAKRYGQGSSRPLYGYLTVVAVYSGTAATAAALARLTGRQALRLALSDVFLLTTATHKLSRLLTKDAVTSPLRAPFTRYQEPAGEGELNEGVRASGTGHAVGELLVCPFCAAVWVATGLTAGMVFAPRLTRLVATTFTAVAGSDFLNLGYDAAKQRLDQLAS
ncbi:DUF1360 domain-containing protein [Actinocatenispora sera]|uniref:DUF1360 domain-containing protein n=1 Tax=Actinocatenispora sera TaxID=390989 RepID=A0A810LA16_9ACTN|nr:DUF1360 domain-containing protein [Actinocatenispora sera]BCJ31725.1 hypothetical protein Asera_58330 [Actinocatenispora sera]